jgi:hypothetical protein
MLVAPLRASSVSAAWRLAPRDRVKHGFRRFLGDRRQRAQACRPVFQPLGAHLGGHSDARFHNDAHVYSVTGQAAFSLARTTGTFSHGAYLI